MGKKRETRGLRRNIVFSSITTILLVVMLVGSYIATAVYTTAVDGFFTVYDSSKKASTDVTSSSDWQQLAKDIEGEGTILLKNDNNVLPLASGTKINLLGYRAYNPVYAGSGSGSVDTTSAITLTQGLTDAGFEVNTTLSDFYASNAKKEEASTGLGMGWASFAIDEVPVSKFTDANSFENLAAYSEVAVVAISRAGGEGSDLTDYTSDDGKHYLELSTDEEALIAKATETFDTVIVLYNGANPLELGFVEKYNVDAALWVGDPGTYGFESVGQVLSGVINPSGRLTDTYAYDALSAPAMNNFGLNTYSNVTLAANSDDTTNAYYVDYVEGIYVGYKWYETADAEGYFEKNNTSYDAVVQYPFGYGLSYTTFKESIVDGTTEGAKITSDGKISLDIKVTNTGSTAGKDVVEVYYTAPYTQYDIDNGIEKSAVNLVENAKTDILQPGDSTTLTVEFDVQDMASYDDTHDNGDGTIGSYMLDDGDYSISLRTDSHTVVDSRTVSFKEQYFYSGNNKRSGDDQQASNQFQDAERGTYLSRNNGFANYDEAMNSVSDVADQSTIDALNNYDAYDASYDTSVTKDLVEDVDYLGENSTVDTSSNDYLTLSDLAGVSYDDPKWDILISQIKLSDMRNIICTGGFKICGIKTIGTEDMAASDGPNGVSSMFSEVAGTAYPATIVLASSWNQELASRYGKCYADEAQSLNIIGNYAPAMNIHRTPFSGRNFEYYSEDGTLSSLVSKNVTLAMRTQGCIPYLKHFALNDQETKRNRFLCTWANEQSIREIYLKPFEESVKEGKATAVMAAFNFIGTKWASHDEALLTEVLRNEWGFRGLVSTDAADGVYLNGEETVNRGIRAGNDTWLTFSGTENMPSVETNADKYYAMKSTKNILYAEANAKLIYRDVYPWRTVLYIVDIIVALLFATSIGFLIKKILGKRKTEVEITDKL